MTQYVSWGTLAWIVAVIVAFGAGHWMGYWYGRWIGLQEYMDSLKKDLARKLSKLPPQGRG
jgi:membrane protein DedA with SNARE-associated domain